VQHLRALLVLCSKTCSSTDTAAHGCLLFSTFADSAALQRHSCSILHELQKAHSVLCRQ
jgi:hypothetical protein